VARVVVADVAAMAEAAEEASGLASWADAWWAAPAEPAAPPLPPGPPLRPGRADHDFPFDRDPALSAESRLRYPFDRRPVLYRSRGGAGRYVVFGLGQPIRVTPR
jgi:hypothetical protein